MSFDPQAAVESLWKIAPEYAKAKGQRVLMEEFRKSLKAQLMKASGVDSIGAQEREAYAHPDYETHLKGLSAAVEQEECLRWRLVSAQAAIEVWRSTNASNRQIERATT